MDKNHALSFLDPKQDLYTQLVQFLVSGWFFPSTFLLLVLGSRLFFPHGLLTTDVRVMALLLVLFYKLFQLA